VNARLKVNAIAVLLAALVWAVAAPIASANFLMHITVDSSCEARTHNVSIETTDMTQDETITLLGQVKNNGSWSDSGSQVTLTIPKGRTTPTTTQVTIPDSGTYRVRV